MGESQDTSFLALKEALVKAPVLTFPNETDMFLLDTDASNHTIGATLSQIQDGEERLISYASKRLGQAQEKYCVTSKELSAVVVFMNQFKHYLLGRSFILRTDHSSLSWLFRFKSPQGQLARWLEELSQFSFQILHRPGKDHTNADALSQIPDRAEPCDCYQAGTYLKDLPCEGCKYCTKLHGLWERFEDNVDNVVPIAVRSLIDQNPAEVNWAQTKSKEDIITAQEDDPCLHQVRSWVEQEKKPDINDIRCESHELRSYWLLFDQFSLRDGLLKY